MCGLSSTLVCIKVVISSRYGITRITVLKLLMFTLFFAVIQVAVIIILAAEAVLYFFQSPCMNFTHTPI